MTGIELFILIGGCYALYTVGMAIATEIDYRRTVDKLQKENDSLLSGTRCPHTYQLSFIIEVTTNKSMTTLHNEDMLLQIFDEVCEAFPYLDEEKQIEIANNKFQELCQ